MAIMKPAQRPMQRQPVQQRNMPTQKPTQRPAPKPAVPVQQQQQQRQMNQLGSMMQGQVYNKNQPQFNPAAVQPLANADRQKLMAGGAQPMQPAVQQNPDMMKQYAMNQLGQRGAMLAQPQDMTNPVPNSPQATPDIAFMQRAQQAQNQNQAAQQMAMTKQNQMAQAMPANRPSLWSAQRQDAGFMQPAGQPNMVRR